MTEKELFQNIYSDVLRNGKLVSPRGLKVLEIENYSYTLPPFVRFTNFKPRNFNLDYVKREFLWYLHADLHDLSIAEHASIWRGLIVDGKLNSNYGYYAFTQGGMQWCYDELVSDRDSRRACITILDHTHLNMKQKDVPCTGYLNFRIRDNHLNMSVKMRSQDSVWGMATDAPCFSFLQEMLLNLLRFKYSDLQMGDYHHTADSFHIYERHFELLEKLCAKDVEFTPIDCPRIDDFNEVQYLVNFYPKGVRPARVGQRFSNWLTEVEGWGPVDWSQMCPTKN